METWEATYRITTPLFLGGASSAAEAELRPPSLKGLLRFWFRAIALPALGNWQKVQEVENILFGSTNGQACFFLSIVNPDEIKSVKPNRDWEKRHGLGYLGYGIMDRGMMRRSYLINGGLFTLKTTLKRDVTTEFSKLLPIALKALGLFGGAGARARNGFGSLSLESLRHNGEEKWLIPGSIEELRKSIRNLVEEMGLNSQEIKDLPNYTAFSPWIKIKITRTAQDPLALLDDVGKELLRYRSYGNASSGIHVLPWREKAEQNFADDHDMVLNLINGRTNQLPSHPRRVVFGLPHNYFFLSTRQRANVDAANYKRRAAPLFIHIHALSTGEYAAILSLLPALFLPEGELIKISCGRYNKQVACHVNYQEIENFLNRSIFNNGVVVWP
jgi:CRISPR-associated protein Cmr1